MRTLEIGFDVWHDCIKVVLLGDIHLGARTCAEELVEATRKRLQESNTYWIDLGDAIDAVNMRDPRFNPAQLPEWVGLADLGDLPAAQVSRYRHYFGHLGKTCLARLSGNHEATLQKHTERNVYRLLNEAIGLPSERALGYSGFLRLRFRRRTGRKGKKISDTWAQTLFLHHGAGGGALAGAKALRLERLPLAFDADIFAVGHTHTKLVLQKTRFGMHGHTGALQEQQQIMVNVGSFLRGIDEGPATYAEARGLYPQGLGPVELWFYPSERQVRIIQ